MHIKMSGCLLLAVMALSAVAGPSRIALVPARGSAELERLAQAGVMVYGRAPGLILAEPSSLPAGQAGVVEVQLAEERETYLVQSPRDPGLLPKAAVWREDNVALVQLSATELAEMQRLGLEFQRLPVRPHRLWLAPAKQHPLPTATDTLIQRLVARVSADSIRRQMRRLQDFRTRFSFTDSCRAAEQYICDYFTALSLDSVQLDTFQFHGVTMRNVVGTKLGRRSPDQVAIICGHMDATSEDPYNSAPGAEDNVSGTAVAIEAARVLAAQTLDQTVKFIAFTAEEQGLIGSYHYAGLMRNRNADISGALNFDMIAWPGGQFGVTIVCDSNSLGLARMEARMAELYTSLQHEVVVGRYGSDQLSFHEFGYHATAGAEYGAFYPYYHTTADTLGHLSMPLAAEVAKMGIAALVTLAVSPSQPEDFRVWDAGIGGTLEATWRANQEPDLAGYRLVMGTTPGVYSDTFVLGRVTSRRVSGLENGRRYFLSIVAFDSAGHESGPAPEQSAVPNLLPLAPAGVSALPVWRGLSIAWSANGERDLAGYNLYRSTTSGSGYVKITPTVRPDTSYLDSGLLSDTMYYYVVTALDSSANESPHSAEVRGKPITLDHGILLVDETRDGTGQRGSPSDAQQDAFYHALLRGTRYRDWDTADESIPLAGDLGPYSTVVWHADDYAQQRIQPAGAGLANYLAQGGRLWLVGWKPILGLVGSGRYPFTFTPGSLAFDGLHLAKAGQCEGFNLLGALGESGYPGITLDSTKLYPSFAGRLPFADVLYPRDAEVVLTFNSATGDSFQGKPVGVRWLAGPGKAVAFGFPLYYTVESEALALARQVLGDLGEPIGLEESVHDQGRTAPRIPTLVRHVLLLPAGTSRPALLLDPAGRQVMVLRPGANNLRGLGPGVYFWRNPAGNAAEVKKMVLVR